FASRRRLELVQRSCQNIGIARCSSTRATLPMRLWFIRLTIIAVFAWALLSLGACAPTTGGRGARTAAAVAPKVIGEIAVVDEEKRFVLIDLDSSLYEPPAGTILHTANATRETGRVRVSAEKKRPFVAADIVAGNPSVGD